MCCMTPFWPHLNVFLLCLHPVSSNLVTCNFVLFGCGLCSFTVINLSSNYNYVLSHVDSSSKSSSLGLVLRLLRFLKGDIIYFLKGLFGATEAASSCFREVKFKFKSQLEKRQGTKISAKMPYLIYTCHFLLFCLSASLCISCTLLISNFPFIILKRKSPTFPFLVSTCQGSCLFYLIS